MSGLDGRDSGLLAEALTHMSVDECRRLSTATYNLAIEGPMPDESPATARVLFAFSVVLANVADDRARLFEAAAAEPAGCLVDELDAEEAELLDQALADEARELGIRDDDPPAL